MARPTIPASHQEGAALRLDHGEGAEARRIAREAQLRIDATAGAVVRLCPKSEGACN